MSHSSTSAPSRPPDPVGRVRDLAVTDAGRSAALHARVLDMEFISQLGPSFLRTYHKAWIDSPVALALAVDDPEGRLVGILLGSLDPAVHVSAILQRHGGVLAARLLMAASIRPGLAATLVRTRVLRYARGLTRVLVGSLRARRRGRDSSAARPPRLGEVTHLFVEPSCQGTGVGRALLDEAVRRATTAGLVELELVTPPDLVARLFYERLGWRPAGLLTSRSGEEFVRYRLPLTG